MTTTSLITATALGLVLSLGAATAVTARNAPQDDPSTHIGTNVAPKAQLDREHRRAVAAGDWANDPYDSRSSDTLNQAQLQGTPFPGSAPGMASLPMTDDNTGISSDMSTGMTGDTSVMDDAVLDDNTNNNQVEDDTATPPPSDEPAVSIPQQDNGSTSMPSSDLPPTSSEAMPQSQLPTSTDATTPQ